MMWATSLIYFVSGPTFLTIGSNLYRVCQFTVLQEKLRHTFFVLMMGEAYPPFTENLQPANRSFALDLPFVTNDDNDGERPARM